MSWDDDRDEARKNIRRWFGDFLPEDVFRQIEEMMDQMMRDLQDGSMIDPKTFDEMIRDYQGTSPFVFGFSMNVGPDGKPVIRRFGNPPHEPSGERLSVIEPLVDVVEEDGEIIVVAEVPGVDKDEIKVRVKGTALTIHSDNPNRPYHKEVNLPAKVSREEARSAIRNGVLEVRLKKA
jgi:HSP20 family protein